MTISGSNILDSVNSASQSSYVTAAVALVANRLYVLSISNAKATAPGIPIVTGAGMTWTQVQTAPYNTVGNPTQRLTVLRSLSATPGSGPLTIDFGGQVQAGCQWALNEIVVAMALGINGDGNVVQSAFGHSDTSPAATASLTMAPFAAPTNAVLVAWAIHGNNRMTPKTGYTELSDNGFGSAATSDMETEFKVGADTAPSVTVTGNTTLWGGIALELTELPAAPVNLAVDNATHAQAAMSVALAGAAQGYINMHPSGRGFVYDDGITPFIPVGANADRLFHRWFNDDPVSGREYNYFLGARGADSARTATPPGYTFDAYFAACAAAGVNTIRVWFGLGQDSAEGGAYSISIEPIPIGRYYLFDVCLQGNHAAFLDPNGTPWNTQVDGLSLMSSFPACRWPDLDNAHCGPTYGPKLQASFVTRVLKSAEAHNVKIHLVLFAITEFTRPSSLGWAGSAWNTVNGGPCVTQDDYYTNASAWVYQKRRVDFIMQLWGDSPAIWSWDVFNEIEFGGTLLDTTRQAQRVTWAQNMCNYVKSVDPHHRPVTSSGFPNLTHPDYATMDNRFQGPSHSYATWHDYNNDLLATVKARLRASEAAYGKLVHVDEMWPWSASNVPGPNTSGLGVESSMLTNPPTENNPYRPSLLHSWVMLVGTAAGSSNRWGTTGMNGVTDPDTYTQGPVNRPLARFITQVNWATWNYFASAVWDNFISATNSDFSLGRGDGDQVMLLLHGTAVSSNLTVSNLFAGAYTLRVFDFLTGNLVDTATVTATNGSVSYSLNLSNAHLDTLPDGQDRQAFAVVLIESQTNAIVVVGVDNAVQAQLADDLALTVIDPIVVPAPIRQGVASIVAVVDRVNQAAAIPSATPMYTLPDIASGLYRLSWYAKVTQAATDSSTLGALKLSYTEATDGSVLEPTVLGTTLTGEAAAINTLNTTDAVLSGVADLWAKGSTNLNYAFGYLSSGAAMMQYELHLKLEYLG